MKLNTDCMVPIEDIKVDFTKAEEIVDAAGMALVIKDNKPRYVILDYNQFLREQNNSNENIEDIAGRIAFQNHSDIEQLYVRPENDLIDHTIKLEDILSLNEDYKADDPFGLYSNKNITEEKISRLNEDTPNGGNKIDNFMDEDKKAENREKAGAAQNSFSDDGIKLNIESYSDGALYLDEVTKKTIEELKELIKGKN